MVLIRAEAFLCVGGTEVINGNRSAAYIADSCLNGYQSMSDCLCETLEDEGPYTDPATDDAPWYEASIPQSADFLGFVDARIELLSVGVRAVTPARVGGYVGPLRLNPRIVQVTAYMAASSAAGMAYGERWLAAALNGTYCKTGCSADDAEVLPACMADVYESTDDGFRKLARVGIIDGPTYSRVNDRELEADIQQVSFQLTAGKPWLYRAAETLADEELPYGDQVCELVSTVGWPGDTGVRITIQAPETGDLEDVEITLNGSPSVSCPDDSTMPYVSMTVPVLEAGAYLVIDGSIHEVTRYDPTQKLWLPGMDRLSFAGQFAWPEVPPNSDACVCVTNGSGETAGVLIERIDREL